MEPVFANTGEYVQGVSMTASEPAGCTTLGRKYSYHDDAPSGMFTVMLVAFSTSMGYTRNCDTGSGAKDEGKERHSHPALRTVGTQHTHACPVT